MDKRVVSGVSALAIGVTGVGIYLAAPALAGSPDGRPAASTKHVNKNNKQRKGPRARLRGVHGQETVRAKTGFKQVTWQRGQVSAVASGTLSVRSLDGVTWKWTTAKNTRFRKNGQKSTAVANGDYVFVVGSGHTARLVIAPKKVPAKATQSPHS